MKLTSLSVFFPAYNEEKNIARTITQAKEVLLTYPFPWEIIVVDDGSSDQTKTTAERAGKGDKRIRVVSQQNGGYGSALQTGFREARYDWVVYTDADGQFNFSDLDKLLPLTNDFAAIWGIRTKRNDPWYRFLFAKVWRISVQLLFSLPLQDIDCGFKLIRKDALEAILPLSSKRGAMINVELAAKLKKRGYALTQVAVSHFPRLHGSPTGSSLKVIIASYCDLIKLRISMASL